MFTTRSLFVASAAAVVALSGISTAHAIPVTYFTVGLLNGAASRTVGDSTITFESQPSTTVEEPLEREYPFFTNINYGEFVVTGGTAPADSFDGTTFTLQVFQTAPSGGSTNFVGQITGVLTTIGSTLQLQITSSLEKVIVSGGFGSVYRIEEFTLISNGDTDEGRRTDLEGQVAVTDNPNDIPGIPEPASMILFGMGGIGLLGGAVRRRRAEKAAA